MCYHKRIGGAHLSSLILINSELTETRVAHLEDNELVELHFETRSDPTLVGSIFLGKVSRVLPGMQACFVDIGLEKAAFLYVGDIYSRGDMVELGDAEVLNHQEPPIEDLIKEGERVLVQVMKDPLGTKGARITTQISLPGRYLVYMPGTQHIGISRKIENESVRGRLRDWIQKIDPQAGVIVRTASEDAGESELARDLEFLKSLWGEISRKKEEALQIGVIFHEIGVEQRILRDTLGESIQKVIFDSREAFLKCRDFVAKFMPQFSQKLELYEGRKPLFDAYDLELEIARSLGRKVWLKSGGYIVIDEAEALVVIDVNTGRYTGKKDLEETLFKTNLEAAREIAHQIRIRNLGGIIIVDFIDMESHSNRESLMQVLRQEMAKDRVRTEVNPMSSLGLVEMTRKRTRPSLSQMLCEPCEACDGVGYLKRPSTLANELLRNLRRELSHSLNRSPGEVFVEVRCRPEIKDWILENEADSLLELELKWRARVQFLDDASRQRPSPGESFPPFEIILRR